MLLVIATNKVMMMTKNSEMIAAQPDLIAVPAAKAASAWALVGGASLTLSEWASLAALIYTSVLLGEWIWKRIGRRMAINRGWISDK